MIKRSKILILLLLLLSALQAQTVVTTSLGHSYSNDLEQGLVLQAGVSKLLAKEGETKGAYINPRISYMSTFTDEYGKQRFLETIVSSGYTTNSVYGGFGFSISNNVFTERSIQNEYLNETRLFAEAGVVVPYKGTPFSFDLRLTGGLTSRARFLGTAQVGCFFQL